MCLSNHEKSSLGKDKIEVPELKVSLTTSHDMELETNQSTVTDLLLALETTRCPLAPFCKNLKTDLKTKSASDGI